MADQTGSDNQVVQNTNTEDILQVHTFEVMESENATSVAPADSMITDLPQTETKNESIDMLTDIHVGDRTHTDNSVIDASTDIRQAETSSPEKETVRILINPSKRTEKRISKRNEIILVSGMMVFLAATIGIVVWQTNKPNCKTAIASSTRLHRNIAWPQTSGNAILRQQLTFEIQHKGHLKFQSQLDWARSDEESSTKDSSLVECSVNRTRKQDICLEWAGSKRLTIHFIRNNSENLDCYEVEWQALSCVSQALTDCVNIASSHWYGGYHDKQQLWPFSRTNKTFAAYVANDTYIGEIGGVLERYFFSSNGTAIYIDNDVPLFFSINNPEGTMCFTARYDKYPYNHDSKTFPFLKYRVCQAENIKEIHTKMAQMTFKKPKGIPSEDLFRYPIWSTWVQFQKDVNQSSVLAFANDILKYNFTHAQLEIDDDWTPKYGDMVFNTDKFPNATYMINLLSDLGFKVTVWVHPFFNIDSDTFSEAAREFRLIRAYDSRLPALVSWWDGTATGILDVSNASACEWFLGLLEKLRNTYNITSFKFDAGETGWLPHIYSSAYTYANPSDMYPRRWVQIAVAADKSYRQEVRVGYQTQRFPIFVRMIDKLSNWGHNNGLKSVIPSALTFGLLGYPFVLPDMIGGNGQLPDPELFIRWLQMNTFLPSMQFSTVPWAYNETIINIARTFTKMHEDVSDIMISLARESVRGGSPIIRPLWWIAPDDEEALICETEFLVGDDILVAPVLEPGARERDIYLPSGSWHDQLRNNSITGGRWLYNYTVKIDELAYFSRA